MKLEEYTPARFELLAGTMARAGRASSLTVREFVDYYYAGGPWCRLYLAIDGDELAGMIGSESMPFLFGERPVTLGLGSNYHSLKPGVGGALYLQWLKSCDLGVVHGGSADTHKILASQKWTYLEGVETSYLNRHISPVRAGEPPHRVLLKRLARLAPVGTSLRRSAAHLVDQAAREGYELAEAREYTEDLAALPSGFVNRVRPELDYLRWRYGLDLSFARYRLFRLTQRGRLAAYVVLNDGRDQVLVAHSDAIDERALTLGVVLALVALEREAGQRRRVIATTSQKALREALAACGFRPQPRAFAVGSLRRTISIPTDAAQWLVNFDWTDNGLRAFL
jgi:hypothetical protein